MASCVVRLGTNPSLALGSRARTTSRRARTHRRARAPRAPCAADDKGGGGEGKAGDKGGSRDWDDVWKELGKGLRESGLKNPADYVDFVEPSKPKISRNDPPRRQNDPARAAKDQIKRDEALILNTFTSEQFSKVGIGSVVALLFFFVVVIGPPPGDGRCTLPWC